MTDLLTIFYIVAIIFMSLGIFFLLLAIAWIIFVFRTALKIRRRIKEKIKFIEKVKQHPEEIIAQAAASFVRAGFSRFKQAIRRKKS